MTFTLVSDFTSDLDICVSLSDIFNFYRLIEARGWMHQSGLMWNFQAETTAARVLVLQLTDGAVEVQAMEYRPIPALNTGLTPGTKVSTGQICDEMI